MNNWKPEVGDECIYQENGGCRWNIKIDYIGKDIFVGTSGDGFELTDKLSQINPLKTTAEIEQDRIIDKALELLGHSRGDFTIVSILKQLYHANLLSDRQAKPLSYSDFSECPDGMDGWYWLIKEGFAIKGGEQ